MSVERRRVPLVASPAYYMRTCTFASDMEPIGSPIGPLCARGDEASTRAYAITQALRSQASAACGHASGRMGGMDVLIMCDGFALITAVLAGRREYSCTSSFWCNCGCGEWRSVALPGRNIDPSDFAEMTEALFDQITRPWRNEMPNMLDLYTSHVGFDAAGKPRAQEKRT